MNNTSNIPNENYFYDIVDSLYEDFMKKKKNELESDDIYIEHINKISNDLLDKTLDYMKAHNVEFLNASNHIIENFKLSFL